MENVLLIIITALCSGLIATIITIFWQKAFQIKQEKRRIFSVLMSKRYDFAAEESVEALNMIEVVFYSSSKVRDAWKEFNDAANSPESPTREQTIRDKHLRLLEVIAEDIGYKNLKWDNIKQYYYPIGLSNKLQDEAILRRVQIDAGIAQLNSVQAQSSIERITPEEELKNQALLKLLENPDNAIKLFELAEKAQEFGKKQSKPGK